jgi:hypothetical protein
MGQITSRQVEQKTPKNLSQLSAHGPNQLLNLMSSITDECASIVHWWDDTDRGEHGGMILIGESMVG